ncbi:MAG: CotH kinase family protein [Pseudomonadota bacterium]|nr:CotH kinase family protein [Pseudomonadota bacterium]
MLLFVLQACSDDGPTPVGPRDAPDPVEEVPADTAPAWVACEGAPPVRLQELVAANHHGATDADGDTSDWIELGLPDGAEPVDIGGWSVSDGGEGWVLPARTLDPAAPLVVWASSKDRAVTELHADFGLDALGEDLFLRMPDGCVADHVATGRLYADVAYGRDDSDAWGYFLTPTPGETNHTEWRVGFADPPVLSPPGGFHADVEVTAAGSDVRYTLDGAPPDVTSEVFPVALALDAVDAPVVVRARAFADGLWPSRVATATYFEDTGLAAKGVRIISLAADPPDLFDPETGIYELGPDAEPNYPYFGANFWEVVERDVHVEVFAPGGASLVDQDAGLQIAGGYSRAFDQRNFELVARSGYGPDVFGAPIFADEPFTVYHRLYLRNGGDWCSTQLVDGTVQALFRDADGRRNPTVDAQAYEPALVYINGALWGVYELKERLDEWYAADHHGVDPDELDRVKLGWTHDANWELEQGTWTAFDALEALVNGSDLADPVAYAAFEAQVDIDNFIATNVVQGWIGNTDWWGNNIRMWRPAAPGGRFRWMAYDFGHGWPDWGYDHLATTVNGTWKGLPIGAALANPTFRDRFVNIHADFLNTSLAGEEAAARFDALADEVRPVMAMQRQRWCGGATMSQWESAVDYARTFAERRADVVDSTLRANLGLAGHATLGLRADPSGAGSFDLAVVTVDPPFDGRYYLGVPVTVTAVAADGYVFAGWADGLGESASRTLPMDADTEVTARFDAR